MGKIRSNLLYCQFCNSKLTHSKDCPLNISKRYKSKLKFNIPNPNPFKKLGLPKNQGL